MMEKVAIFLLLAAGAAFAQTDNTFYVKTFPGSTVGAKTVAAQKACAANTAIPCIIIFDPSLAAYASGTAPAKCTQCVWEDWRAGALPNIGPRGLPGGSLSYPGVLSDGSNGLGLDGLNINIVGEGIHHGAYAQGNSYGPALFSQTVLTDNGQTLDHQNATATFLSQIKAVGQPDASLMGALTIPQFAIPILFSAIRADPASKGYLIGISGIVTDFSTTGVVGKGSIVATEFDLANNSTQDYSAWDDDGSISGSDWYGVGTLITSVGTNKGGRGLHIKANGLNGIWRRGEIIQDWDQAGLDVINNIAGSTAYNLSLRSKDATLPANILWGHGAPTVLANIDWIEGVNANTRWRSLYDPVAGIGRFTFKPGGETRFSSASNTQILLNMDVGSSTAGTCFGSGGGTPYCAGLVDGGGNYSGNDYYGRTFTATGGVTSAGNVYAATGLSSGAGANVTTGYSIAGVAGVTVNGTSCVITSIVGGIIMAAHCQ